MPMSPERRTEIRTAVAAVEKLHPGPWFAVPITDTPEVPAKDLPCIPHPHWDLCYGDKQSPSNVACILTDYDDDGVKGHVDINFIVGCRQWVPELLDEVDRLNAQLKEWEQYTGFLHAHGFFRDATTITPDVKLTTTEGES